MPDATTPSNQWALPGLPMQAWMTPLPGAVGGNYPYAGQQMGPWSLGSSFYSSQPGQSLSFFGGETPYWNQTTNGMAETPQALNPLNVINALKPQIEQEQQNQFANAANKFGRAGMLQSTGNGSGYQDALLNVARKSASDLAAQYWGITNQAAENQANRSMTAAQNLAGMSDYFQQQPWNVTNQMNQFGNQQYMYAQSAMDKQYQDWLRMMYGNQQGALAAAGNPNAQANYMASPQSSGSGWQSILPIIGMIAGLV